VDRDSAHEMLARRAERAAREAEGYDGRDDWRDEEDAGERYSRARRYQPPGRIRNRVRRDEDDEPRARTRSTPARSRSRSSRSDTMLEAFGKSMARSLGSGAGRMLTRGVLGTLFRGR
jgi:hypothetical protein